MSDMLKIEPSNEPMNSPSDLSISTIGVRKKRHALYRLKHTTDLVLADLVLDSTLFKNPNPEPLPLPVFDPTEVELGMMLGQGEFGVVLEVMGFNVDDECKCRHCSKGEEDNERTDLLLLTPATIYPPASPARAPPKSIFIGPTSPTSRQRTSSVTFAEHGKQDEMSAESESTDEQTQETQDLFDVISAYDELDIEHDDDSLSDMGLVRGRMSAHCLRHSVSRFAVKRLREGVGIEIKADAVIDLACEPKYLASFSHPNIVRLRATVGTPGTPGFLLVLDRLTLTLEEKIHQWSLDQRKFRGVMGFGRDAASLDKLLMQRLIVAFDIARAMKYLHKKKILYRDIKADNIGFDVRGDARPFDFGLAKELKAKDLVKHPDQYETTGLTGSRRYMAPEVVSCLPYGFSADVFSFGILFWQMMALQTPFYDFDTDKHFDQVVVKAKRPHRLKRIPKLLHKMMELCWSADPSKRPNFKQVSVQLQSEIVMMKGGTGANSVIDRSNHLMNRSLRSFYTLSEREGNRREDRL